MSGPSPRSNKLPVHWADMCRTLLMFGLMKDTSKNECLRVYMRLKRRIDEGKVERSARGVYRLRRVR
jgi:hypothetical protein